MDEWLDLIVVFILLYAVPFALAGFVLGYLPKPGHARPWKFVLGSVPLIVIGILGAASIGVAIYPVGVILFSMGLGQMAKRASLAKRSSEEVS